MKIARPAAKELSARMLKAIGIMSLGLILGMTEGLAQPTFYSTTDTSHWQVATSVGGTDGLFSSFPASGFVGATAISGRPGWIANNSTGTNGGCPGCTWVFFVFRQSFDLTGFDPSTAHLQFQWAADDSGEGFAARGTWVPKFNLNGGGLVPWGSGPTYSFGPTVDLTSGFVAGLNVIDFYVEGNSVTDGFALSSVAFTADTVAAIPEPETYALQLAGLGLLGWRARQRAHENPTAS